jgi:NTP pyrophosphatase (non-canonical NTP hydrolase)
MRREVTAFAEAMERKMGANDHKDEDIEWLRVRLREELAELDELLDNVGHGRVLVADILNEAADCATFLMMIADNCGALATVPAKGVR